MNSLAASGAGATISSVGEYAKLMRCLMTMAPPLSLAGHAALRHPRIVRGSIAGIQTRVNEFDLYSLGLDISYYRGEMLIWHTGGLPGFKTIMGYLPSKQWGVVTMANALEGAADDVLVFKLIDDLLDVPPLERFDWGKQTESVLQQRMYTLRHAREVSYPHAPSPPLPLTLPLSEYAGVYTHPAYPPFYLTLSPDLSRLSSRSYHHLNGDPIYVLLSHVSGGFFLVWSRAFADKEAEEGDWRPWIDEVTKGEFRIGGSGRVERLGINIEPEMGEKKIWWRKV